MQDEDEQELKHARVRALLNERGADALLLRRASSFAWATGGISSVINQAADAGEGAALYTRDARVLLASEIEAPRYRLETAAAERGWDVRSFAWEGGGDDPLAALRGDVLLADMPAHDVVDVGGEVSAMRARLLPVEHDRLRELGRDCADIVETAARNVRPGMTEYEVAAVVAHAALVREVEPIVVLVAADERARLFRHPRPTGRVVEAYVMVVLCGRRDGLVCSVTRCAHLGPVPTDLAERHVASCTVDAALLAASRPGATFGGLFDIALAAYAEAGFSDAWREHHQGGLAGYEPREGVASPGSPITLEAGHACSWNPSVAGTKSEDTVIVHTDGVEVVTDTGEWPRTAVVGSDAPPRTDILVR